MPELQEEISQQKLTLGTLVPQYEIYKHGFEFLKLNQSTVISKMCFKFQVDMEDREFYKNSLPPVMNPCTGDMLLTKSLSVGKE